ncbi:leucine-rich repeat protein [Corynebacterium choanae]|uniref:Leucine-rich repeat domain-containing protein n=1 Tax=Corynebacterium choanae TaxID=1862358 RepID=A0A3G6J9C2_9CORY|nr:leucine-rich repeat protein [Corynebacterium choanae]AZA14725.1 hypothetical protein CCHOA_11770 [Corynebacterium choanae]
MQQHSTGAGRLAVCGAIALLTLSGCQVASSSSPNPGAASPTPSTGATSHPQGLTNREVWEATAFAYQPSSSGDGVAIRGFRNDTNPHPGQPVVFPDTDPTGQPITEIAPLAFCYTVCGDFITDDTQTEMPLATPIHEQRMILAIDRWPAQLRRIGDGAFTYNQLQHIPNHWGTITHIGAAAFEGNHLQSLPQSWEGVVDLGESAFAANKLTAIPASFGVLTTLPAWVFSGNQLQAIAGDFGNVTQIGAGAFSHNQLQRLPRNWGSIKTLADGAFADNALETLAPAWDGVTSIGQSAFAGNALRALPQQWGQVRSLGAGAFADNALQTLPSHWGELQEIPAEAFARNTITALPATFGAVTHIGVGAFQGNQIIEVPAAPALAVDDYAFADNRLLTVPSSWEQVLAHSEGSIAGNPLCGQQPTDTPIMTADGARIAPIACGYYPEPAVLPDDELEPEPTNADLAQTR